ncbi:MAG: alpha/beta fold hydrolase, partial [Roseiflexaceae bacterium]
MVSWHSTTVDTGQVQLYVQSAGQGQPIIMLHGMTDSGDCWKPFANQLATRYVVYLVDARGHGLSDKTCETVAHVDQVADVHALITQLNLVKPFLIGHSMGAMVAYIAACSYPTHIRAVVLEDPRFRPITLVTE